MKTHELWSLLAFIALSVVMPIVTYFMTMLFERLFRKKLRARKLRLRAEKVAARVGHGTPAFYATMEKLALVDAMNGEGDDDAEDT